MSDSATLGEILAIAVQSAKDEAQKAARARRKTLMQRLQEMPSQMPEATDHEWWNRLVEERFEAVAEIKRLNKSRNRWAQKYTKLLLKSRSL